MPEPGITVTGAGSASGEPDVATLSLGAEAQRPGVADAFDAAGAAMTAMVAAVRAAGVAGADLHTGGVDLRSAYEHEGRGYLASQQLSVRVRDLDDLGALVSAAVRAGGDAARLHGLHFSFSDPEAELRSARERAWADARAKAEQYAALAGRRLGAARGIAETAGHFTHAFRELAGSSTLAAMPVERGTVDVTVAVEVEWAFADGT